jgi:hypothetical protein
MVPQFWFARYIISIADLSPNIHPLAPGWKYADGLGAVLILSPDNTCYENFWRESGHDPAADGQARAERCLIARSTVKAM